ncbi:unnamed protein product [Periconia digitata]|uniref:Uncharacterized protein n=1 Tax=Periconia digitata TaxID=1303443 RepID=A0A9W4XHR8_9PLEO|nr:unnamed protein product [Periconia digitata]
MLAWQDDARDPCFASYPSPLRLTLERILARDERHPATALTDATREAQMAAEMHEMPCARQRTSERVSRSHPERCDALCFGRSSEIEKGRRKQSGLASPSSLAGMQSINTSRARSMSLYRFGAFPGHIEKCLSHVTNPATAFPAS